jgi:predicted transcriptional regulator
LNFKIVKRYLERLTNGGMLNSEESRFYTTEKGVDFIDNYRALISPMKAMEMTTD